jgi:hypothetical protein
MKTLEQVRAALKPYPVEVEFPDIRQWQEGNDGIEYVYSFDSGVAGPHVMIMALTHRNEVSGAITVDAMLRAGLRPRRGRLSLGFGNVEAYHSFDPQNIDATRYLDEDMNRVWLPEKLDGEQTSVELRRARLLRPLIDSVDLLLDIHSMHEEAPPVMMCGARSKGRAFAAALGVPETVIVDAGHANGRRMRDYGGFNDAASGRNALLIETGQHFLEVTEPVVARTMDFTFVDDYRGLELIERAGTVIAYDGGDPIVTPYDNCVLVQPSLRHLGPGVTVVRLAKVLNSQ